MTDANIRKVSSKHYDVKSSKSDEWYMVDIGHKRCTCMDFTRKGFKDLNYECKHIKMVIEYVKEKVSEAVRNDHSHTQNLAQNTQSEFGTS